MAICEVLGCNQKAIVENVAISETGFGGSHTKCKKHLREVMNNYRNILRSEIPDHMKFNGFIPALIKKAKNEGLDGYLNDNLSKAALIQLRRKLYEWIVGDSHYFLWIYGLPGRGKTDLMHRIIYRALDLKPELKARYVTDRAFRDELNDRIRDPQRDGISYLNNLRNKPNIIGIDEFGKSATNWGFQSVWLDSFKRWEERKCLVVICGNTNPDQLNHLESTVEHSDGTAPLYSRLIAIENGRISLNGIDFRTKRR